MAKHEGSSEEELATPAEPTREGVTPERAAEELRDARDKLRVALAISRMSLFSYRPKSEALTWDASAREVLGTEPPATLAEYLDLIHPEDRKLVEGRLKLAVERKAFPDLEHRILIKGQTRWMLSRAEVVDDPVGPRLIGGVVDVSERRLMEEKLRQAQKMEALGELTAGLAHNFNNALMAILPNLEHAARHAPEEVTGLLTVARHAAERAARLVRELMVFAGGQRYGERRDEAVTLVVQRAVELCRSTFSRQIVVDLDLGTETPLLAMDGAQVEHAVMNVCINARDALEGVSGRTPTLRVEVRRVPGNAVELGPSPKAHLEHARIRVSDNGTGMSEEVRHRIFEPFFTTKDIGKGTGLGLSTTYAIVREHSGFITCESRPGQGTSFSLYLPVERIGRRKDSGVLMLPAPKGDELLLVVDDDPVVRGVTARVLASGGYRILEASDGSQGLSVFEQKRESIGLVLLDESMPGIAGHEVLAKMLTLEPSARVAMFTGVQPTPEQLAGARAVIRKPVGANELLWRVRELLDGA
jgi:signal transduction histidine kinase